MKLPRWIHKLYANAFGYFWLPCPICGRKFGGHEWDIERNNNSIKETESSGSGVCPNCHAFAFFYNLMWDRENEINKA